MYSTDPCLLKIMSSDRIFVHIYIIMRPSCICCSQLCVHNVFCYFFYEVMLKTSSREQVRMDLTGVLSM